MTWGFFTTNHIISMLAAVLIVIGLYYLLKTRLDKTKQIVLLVLSIPCLANAIGDMFIYDSPLEYLPLHLCSINALLLPVAIITKNKSLNNLLLLWSLGALVAIILNSATAHVDIFSFTFNKYYFTHVLEFGIPILMFRLNLTKKDIKCILPTVGITFSTYTIIHLINTAINTWCINNNILNPAGELIQINFMYSIKPNNPLSEFFFKIIPHTYWYNMPVLAIICLYLILVYRKEIVYHIKNKKTAQ